MNEKLEELLKNEEFLSKIVSCSAPNELMNIFSDFGVKIDEGITPEEAFNYVKRYQNDDINEEDLEEVSGGVIATGTALAAAGALVLAGAELSFIGGYAFQKLKSVKFKW